MIRNNSTDKEAVSEVVGYVIVVGIILLSIGIVYTNAIPALEQNRESEHISNTEKTFSTLQNNINEVAEREVPRRATELRLYDARMSVGESAMWMNVSAEDGTVPSLENSTDMSTIEYEHSGGRIVYENGAVMRTSRTDDGSAMLYDPGWTVREGPGGDLTVIITNLRTGGFGSVGGDGSVLVRSRMDVNGVNRNGLETEIREESEMTIRIRSEHADAWGRYFEDLAEVDGDIQADTGIGPNQAEIEFDLDSDDTVIYNEKIIRVGITP